MFLQILTVCSTVSPGTPSCAPCCVSATYSWMLADICIYDTLPEYAALQADLDRYVAAESTPTVDALEQISAEQAAAGLTAYSEATLTRVLTSGDLPRFESLLANFTLFGFYNGPFVRHTYTTAPQRGEKIAYAGQPKPDVAPVFAVSYFHVASFNASSSSFHMIFFTGVESLVIEGFNSLQLRLDPSTNELSCTYVKTGRPNPRIAEAAVAALGYTTSGLQASNDGAVVQRCTKILNAASGETEIETEVYSVDFWNSPTSTITACPHSRADMSQVVTSGDAASLLPVGSMCSYARLSIHEVRTSISTACLDSIIELDDVSRTVKFDCARSVYNVTEFLATQNYALPTLGLGRCQTLCGAIATQTHGSSFTALHNHVEQLTIMDGNGEVRMLTRGVSPMFSQALMG